MYKNLGLIFGFILFLLTSTLTIAGSCSVTVTNSLSLNGTSYLIDSISGSGGTVSKQQVFSGQSFILKNDGMSWDTTATGSIYGLDKNNKKTDNIGSMNIEIKNATDTNSCKAIVNSYYCKSNPKSGGPQNCTFYSSSGSVPNGGTILFSIQLN